MTISQRFSNFYHGVVLKQALEQCGQLTFSIWVDDRGYPFTFIRGTNYHDLDDLKELFKAMNIDYPMEGDDKVSTTDITSKELTRHIEWAIKTVGENRVEMKFIKEQWDRLLIENGIEKE